MKLYNLAIEESSLYYEYSLLNIFLWITSGLAVVIFGLSYMLAVDLPDPEKLSSYECGFDPYDDARNAFEVRFYLVAILFIIFDLEAVFLFPWAVSLGFIGSLGYWVMIDFVSELVIGFIYAWKIGALEWE